MAVPVLDAVLGDVKIFLGDDSVVKVVRDVISAETFTNSDEGVRVADVLLVVTVLKARVQRPPVQFSSSPAGRPIFSQSRLGEF